MEVPQPIIDLLKEREGFRTDVYLDSLGKATAGLGHLLLTCELHIYPLSSIVPNDVLNEWIEEDTTACYIAGMNQARQIGISDQSLINALSVVSFQLGSMWHKNFPRCWQCLLNHDWIGVIAQLEGTPWQKETPVRVADFTGVLQRMALQE